MNSVAICERLLQKTREHSSLIKRRLEVWFLSGSRSQINGIVSQGADFIEFAKSEKRARCAESPPYVIKLPQEQVIN